MSDFGDDALEAQERHLRRSLAKIGVRPKEIEIPPPHSEEPAAPDTPADRGQQS